MKRLCEDKYVYQRGGRQLQIAVLSDVHFSEKLDDKLLDAIAANLEKTPPDYVLVPGDLIDFGEIVYDFAKQEIKPRFRKLSVWLERIGRIAPVLICLGNHDLTEQRNTVRTWLFGGRQQARSGYDKLQPVYQAINRLKNVYLLDNDKFVDDKVFVAGFTLPWGFYIDDNARHRRRPNAQAEIAVLQKNKELWQNMPEDKLKVALIHSPETSRNPQIQEMLRDFDLIIYGHMHNGALPNFLRKIFPKNAGLIGPSKTLFPNNARGEITANGLITAGDEIATGKETTASKETTAGGPTSIVASPVTTFSQTAGVIQTFDRFYPAYITRIEIKCDIITSCTRSSAD